MDLAPLPSTPRRVRGRARSRPSFFDGRGTRIAALAALVAACAATPARAQVSGFVVDSVTQAPVAGAFVRVQASNDVTLSAADGSFALQSSGPGLVLAAAKFGYWNGSKQASAPAQNVFISIEPLPAGDDPNYKFTTSASCNFCHQSLFGQWFGSPMAHAGENTWVHDVYSGLGTSHGMGGFVYVRDSKHKTLNKDGDCAHCHAPVLAAQNGGGDTPLQDPASAPLEQAASVACDLCHRVESIDSNKLGFPGVHPQKVTFRRPNGATSPIMFGPLDDAVFVAGPMRPAFNPLFQSAMVCALCHEDKNDHDDDGDYEDPGSVPHQSTWSEWLASPFANPGPDHRDCRDCHMAPVGDTTFCVFGPTRDPSVVKTHAFIGTSPEFLQNAVELELRAGRKNGRITAQVTLTNVNAGHAVPSGSDFRNVILLVTAKDAAGADLTHLGPNTVNVLGGIGDPEQGDYAGQPGRLFGKINFDGALPAQFFSEAEAILFDNRLRPGIPDIRDYSFQPPPTGDVIVEARLIYRRAWRYLALQKRWVLDGHGNPNADLEAPLFGTLMEEARILVKGP